MLSGSGSEAAYTSVSVSRITGYFPRVHSQVSMTVPMPYNRTNRFFKSFEIAVIYRFSAFEQDLHIDVPAVRFDQPSLRRLRLPS